MLSQSEHESKDGYDSNFNDKWLVHWGAYSQATSNGQDGSTDNALCNVQSWGWSGFYDRITNSFQNNQPRMKEIFAEAIGATMSTTNGYVLLL